MYCTWWIDSLTDLVFRYRVVMIQMQSICLHTVQKHTTIAVKVAKTNKANAYQTKTKYAPANTAP